MYFGQDNPHDQLVVIMQSLWGTAENLEEGITTPEKAAREMKRIVAELQALNKHIKGTKWKPY